MVYILKHPQEGFTGFLAGVGFEGGIGSTSNQQDAERLIREFDCKEADSLGRESAPAVPAVPSLEKKATRGRLRIQP